MAGRDLATVVDNYRERLINAVPQHLRGDDPFSVIKGQLGVAMRGTPKLAECDPMTVVYGCYRAARLGLDFSGASGQAYLIPFWNSRRGVSEAQMIVGYKGMITLASRATRARSFRAMVVWQGEPFRYVDGLHPILEHEPSYGAERSSDIPVCAYAIAEWPDGYKAWKVAEGHYLAGIEEEALRKAGGRPTPWRDHRGEMLKKTALRYLLKGLDLSPDVASALDYDARVTAHAHDVTDDGEYREMVAPPEQSRQAAIEAELEGA